MKHNLPAPSQAWGSDIDRRLKTLESLVNVHDNKLNNSSDALNALVQNNAARGVAHPFSFTDNRSSLYFNQDDRYYGNTIYSRQLDWGGSGSFMLVTVSGYITIPVQQNITPSSMLFKIYTYITGANSYGTAVMVPTSSKTLGATLSFTTLIEYTETSDPYLTIAISGADQNYYLVNGSSSSNLAVSVSGVRY